MIAKKQRLGTADFAQPFRLVFRNPAFVVKIRKNNLSYCRFAVVAGSRVDKRAVVRNRLRRLFFAELARWRESGYDVMVVVAPPARQEVNEQLRRTIAEAHQNIFSVKNNS